MKGKAIMTECNFKQVMSDISGLSESGGIFGIWGQEHANHMLYFGLHALQHRGQTSAGILIFDGMQIHKHQGAGLLNHVFENQTSLEELEGCHGIGHVRSASKMDKDEINNVQPLLFQFSDDFVALTHNGNLTNAKTLRLQLEAKGAVFHSTTDAEIFMHLMRQSSGITFEEKVLEAVKQLKGGFNFGILSEQGLIGIVDPSCFRPLIVGQTKSGAYVIASESCAIEGIGAEVVDIVSAGQYVFINDKGYEIKQYAEPIQVSLEPMEFIYFARPDSDIFNINIHRARKKSGEILAKESPAPNADIVIGVPNSSLSAASGYAESADLPYEMGLIKHQYIGRTFIQPTQEMREQGVRQKLSAVRGVVEGKSIVLVDDSIVRGTTSKRLIKLLREAGAKEIHMRIASPPLRFPNYFGIDVQTNDQLIASNHTVEEINKIIGSDSLGFLSLNGLKEAIFGIEGHPEATINEGAFTGKSNVDLADYQASFERQLTPIQKSILEGESIDE